MWVRAVNTYSKVAKSIEPKKKKLASSEKKLQKTQLQLEAKQEKLREVEEGVQQVEEQYRESMSKQEELKETIQRSQDQYKRASSLVGSLKNEEVRWAKTATELKQDSVNMLGNTMMAAAFVAYLGPFTAQYRSRLCFEWGGFMRELGVA
eukprot:871404_1